MICPFCSLLCDSPSSLSKCVLRNSRLDSLATRLFLTSESYAEELERGSKWIAQASSILITGRVTSVDSSRAVLNFAKRLSAIVDLSDREGTMDVATAISRTGACAVSLAEARDLSDVIVVLGDDLLIEQYPRLAQSLEKRNHNQRVILLGRQTAKSLHVWQQFFPDTWSIDCEIDRIPEALHSFFSIHPSPNCGDPNSPPNSPDAIAPLLTANYISLVWSPQSLEPYFNKSRGRSAWIERLLEHQVSWNERRRVGMLMLSGQDAVFQQVCLWTTGYPGRISFLPSSTEFDPVRYSVPRWFAEHKSNPNSLLMECDETASNENSWLETLAADFQGKRILATPNVRAELPPNSNVIHLPTQIAGWDRTADMLRADQVLLARIQGTPNQSLQNFRSLAQWMEALAK